MTSRKTPVRSIVAGLAVAAFLFSILCPSDVRADFFSEDSLKTTGIIIGITLGVALVVVLIVGTMKDLGKGDEEDEEDPLASVPDTAEQGPLGKLEGVLGKGLRLQDWVAETPEPDLPALPGRLVLGNAPGSALRPNDFAFAGRPDPWCLENRLGSGYPGDGAGIFSPPSTTRLPCPEDPATHLF